jgi:hypothetical protein
MDEDIDELLFDEILWGSNRAGFFFIRWTL